MLFGDVHANIHLEERSWSTDHEVELIEGDSSLDQG